MAKDSRGGKAGGSKMSEAERKARLQRFLELDTDQNAYGDEEVKTTSKEITVDNFEEYVSREKKQYDKYESFVENAESEFGYRKFWNNSGSYIGYDGRIDLLESVLNDMGYKTVFINKSTNPDSDIPKSMWVSNTSMFVKGDEAIISSGSDRQYLTIRKLIK